MSLLLRRRGIIGAGGFSPLDIGWDLALWAERETAYADGVVAPTATDWSGNGADATQATFEETPRWYAARSGYNGHPAFVFDGDVDHWDSPAAIGQPITAVVVGFAAASSVKNQSAIAPTDPAESFTFGRRRSDLAPGNTWYSYAGSAILAQTSGTMSTTKADIGIVHVENGASWLRVNGVQSADTDYPGGGTLLGGVRIGANAALDGSWQGSMAFVGIMTGEPTADEIAALEAWASATYATH